MSSSRLRVSFFRRRKKFSLAKRTAVIFPLWLAASLWLWLWWFNSSHIDSPRLYAFLTPALFYEFAILPTGFLLWLLFAKTPAKRRPQKHLKVAVITLCVPSMESLQLIEAQLQAMAAIQYPHDSWILDEGNTPAVKALARKHGVKHFSRKGIAKYNRPADPYKTRTKAGNVNAWLDRVKSRHYDFFVQLDIDHRPKPDYLDKTLGHFRDKKIGWVQAPSVYKNTASWTARGSLEQDMGFHGPLQMGYYGAGGAPVVVGSHATFRMIAIREIGGFQKTRAEDHLNTMAMVQKGWRGVFVPEVIAEGDGPETLSAYLTQQYAWAFSMLQVLKSHTWAFLRGMSLRHKAQFIFAQTWYPLSTLARLLFFVTPLLALLWGRNAVLMTPTQLLVRFGPLALAGSLAFLAIRPSLKPNSVRLSWRGWLLHLIRWPIILRALFSALLNTAKPYMTTPKGKFLKAIPTIKLYRSFLFLSLVSLIPVVVATLFYADDLSIAQLGFAFFGLLTFMGVILVDLNSRLRTIELANSKMRWHWFKPIGAVAMVALIASVIGLSAATTVQHNQIVHALERTAAAQRDLALIPPVQMSQAELEQEIASPQYDHRTSVALPHTGFYSPETILPTNQPYLRHSFIDWRRDWLASVDLLTAQRLGATPLFTVEPKGQTDGRTLLEDIQAGRDDDRLNNLLRIFGLAHETVYVRFAHEMDIATYPWGEQTPQLYIRAYRHVVNLARTRHINNIKWVWSPVGNPDAAAYYPGDDVVDVIGTTMLYDRYWSGDYHPSFQEMASVRNWLRGYNKPVWITEFGAGSADRPFQTSLIRQAVSDFRSAGYQALLYVNIKEPHLVGPDYRFASAQHLAEILGLYAAPQPAPHIKLPPAITRAFQPLPLSSSLPNPTLSPRRYVTLARQHPLPKLRPISRAVPQTPCRLPVWTGQLNLFGLPSYLVGWQPTCDSSRNF